VNQEEDQVPKQEIHTEEAAQALGAYSQGIRAGDFVYVTGCGPVDPATGDVTGDSVEAQTDLAIDNVEAILRAAGATLDDVVKATVHLADETEFSRFNEAYAARFAPPMPVRTTVGSGMSHAPGMRVEIDVVAYTGA
jgi:2-iminobutanoate/2-iminopropanoate deaminase